VGPEPEKGSEDASSGSVPDEKRHRDNGEATMPIGHLSIRINTSRRDHHLWLNNGGVYWVHYTLHWDGRKRRIRRSLQTRDLERAIALRDELFAHIRAHGEFVVPRRSGIERLEGPMGERRHWLSLLWQA
jgi:hypothetical protein